MTDRHLKMLGYKIILPRLFMTGFGIFLFVWIASFYFPILRGIQIFSFESWVLAIWLGVAGLWDMVIGMASMPDAKKGRSRAGAFIIIGIGIVSFILALVFFIGGQDLIYSSGELTLLTLVVFGFAVVLWIAHSAPEALKFKSLVRALN